MSNLQTRVITALVLAALVIGTLVTGSSVLWAGLVLAFCIAAVWEGQRLCGQTSTSSSALGWISAIAVLGSLWVMVFWLTGPAGPVFFTLLLVVSLFWLVVAPVQLATIEGLVDRARQEGATIWQPSWSERLPAGCFFPPTLVANIAPSCEIAPAVPKHRANRSAPILSTSRRAIAALRSATGVLLWAGSAVFSRAFASGLEPAPMRPARRRD